MEQYIELNYKYEKSKNYSYDFHNYPKLSHLNTKDKIRKNFSVPGSSKLNFIKLRLMNKLEKKYYQKNLQKELKDPKNNEIKNELEVYI